MVWNAINVSISMPILERKLVVQLKQGYCHNHNLSFPSKPRATHETTCCKCHTSKKILLTLYLAHRWLFHIPHQNFRNKIYGFASHKSSSLKNLSLFQLFSIELIFFQFENRWFSFTSWLQFLST
jgi:hypothetical protein